MKTEMKKPTLIIIIIAVVLIIGYLVWSQLKTKDFGEGFVNGNGRIEATEINVSTKLAARIEKILVKEGDFVEKSQPLVIMQTDVLEQQLNEARAQLQQAISNEVNAKAQLALKMSDKAATEAVVLQRKSDLDLANRRLKRSAPLHRSGAVSAQIYDDDLASVNSAKAALTAAEAQVAVAEAAIQAAEANVTSASYATKASQATIDRIQADINDSTLIATAHGRVQYKISQVGEVLGAGGKVLNVVDLNDVYLTFFLPETVAGKVRLGDEVRMVLDVFPDMAIPAYVSYVASVAQFTPKTVETQSERQKLMFRVKAQIKPELLNCYLEQIKTGVPGVAWLKLDKQAAWPAELSNLVPMCKKD
ncbi:HlyD family secretion protein [Entomomonas sp. E2T0]|uniref:HlyD family secretion protein n=1 Tax=Entomomonas sp. E2T0 TaxID=2930213 RepID=UPI00222835C2|nr:HlyD family secretion protein [Entomomonas sp. E2T0]UYZ85382.1 HlyD family secretion protein [Entomomonas sp. E2T0]